MNKIKIIITFTLLLALLVSIMTLGNKIEFGRWNFLGYPRRIILFDRYYRTSGFNDGIDTNSIEIFKGNDKPKHEVSTILNKLTGRRFFTFGINKDDIVPYVVYLHINGDEYLEFALEGGN